MKMAEYDWLAFISGLLVGALLGIAVYSAIKEDSGVIIERDNEGRIVGIIPGVRK